MTLIRPSYRLIVELFLKTLDKLGANLSKVNNQVCC